MKPPLVLIPQYFGCLVFDRRSSRYIPFDADATELLVRLVDEPVGGVAARHPEGQAVQGFYRRFQRLGFFTLDGRLAARVLDLTPPPDHLVGPLAVHLELTDRCDQGCVHCFADVADAERSDTGLQLTLEELDRLFGDLAALGAYRLGVTGGEPLMRPDLLEVLDNALTHGLVPCVTTNGLLLDEPLARELGARPLAWLNVSLEGATAAAHDRVRGAGTFARVLANLRLLRAHARFTLAFTVTRQSARQVEACAQLAREVGAAAAVFRPLYPVGRACDHPELMPSYAEYAGALERLDATTASTGGELEVIEPFGPLSRAATQARVYPGPGCGAANLVASVSCTGVVNPCSFLGPAHDAGSIRERPFAEIWQHSPVFKRLRGSPDEAFEGGCRARAQALGGGADQRDPWYQVYKELAAHVG
jgi:MoaA/NifB/PqqE/SkfB family radical SAM enzyme